VREIFLFFLITFTHSSFPLPKAYPSYGSEILTEFKGEFRRTIIKAAAIISVGCVVCCVVLIIGGIISLIDSKISKIDEYKLVKVNNQNNRLTFENDYCGKLSREIEIFMDKFKNPEKYKEIESNKGLLICGKPGVGKTWLVKVLADEVEAELFKESGADLKGQWIGLGAKNVKTLFEKARKTKKRVIIAIDEIDAMSGGNYHGRRTEMDSAIKQLQVEMEGIDSERNRNIKVIGLTNEPQGLSEAVRRRFEITKIDLPRSEERSKILQFFVDKDMEKEKIKEACFLQENIDFNYLTTDEFASNFSHDSLKCVVNNIFTNVVAERKQNEKIIIGDKNFAEEITKLRNKMEIGRQNYLEEDSSPMSEVAQRMYS